MVSKIASVVSAVRAVVAFFRECYAEGLNTSAGDHKDFVAADSYTF